MLLFWFKKIILNKAISVLLLYFNKNTNNEYVVLNKEYNII